MENQKSGLQTLSEIGKNINELIEIAKTHIPASKEPVELVEETFRYLIVFLGIRPENVPDKGEKLVLLDYISRHFKSSLLDIKIAFTLYIQNKLDYSEPVYQHLTIPLLESVIQSYRRYVNQMSQKPALQLTEKTPPTNEEIFKIMVHGAVSCFETYCQIGQLIDLGNVNYDFLSKEGHINFTDELKWKFYNQAKEALKAEKVSRVMAGKESVTLQKLLEEVEGNHFDVVIKKAKKIALEEYFKNLIEMETSLHEVLGIDVPAGIVFNSAQKKQQYQEPIVPAVTHKTWLNWFYENFDSFTMSELLELKKQLVNGSLHGANGAEISRITERLKQLEKENQQ